MTRGSFFTTAVWSSCLVTVSSFTSVLTADGGFRLSGEVALGVEFPLTPPSRPLSRSFIASAGAGEEYFGTDLLPSIALSKVMARSNHGGRGAVFDCLPPRRFFLPFSTYKCAFQSLVVTAQSTSTHIVQYIRCPPITGNPSFHTSEPRNMRNRTADECSVTVPSCPEWSASVGVFGGTRRYLREG